MDTVNFIKPSDKNELLELLSRRPGACLFAGGTELMVRKRSGKEKASVFIDMLLPELCGIREDEEAFLVGAGTTLNALSAFFKTRGQPYEMLSRAADSVGSDQTRNLATVGGNICTGNASSDMATAFLATGASVLIEKKGAERLLPLDRFFLKNRVVSLEKDEIVSAIVIPKPREGSVGAAFLKIGKRRGHVIAILNTAVMIDRGKENNAWSARFAAGTLAPVPLRLYQSERAFVLSMEAQEGFENACEAAKQLILKEIDPRDSRRASREYRMEVAPAALSRALHSAWEAML